MNYKVIKALMVLMVLIVPEAALSTIVKGKIFDTSENEGLPYATVKIFSEADTVRPAGVSVTDIDGDFSLNVNRKGNFTFTCEYLGKHSMNKAFTLNGQDTLDLGVLDMTDDITLMDEVEVVAMKRIVKASSDKLSYSVEDDSDSKSNTLLDMLRKVPLVSVDGEDNITVNGSSSFKVYVNGKPSMMFSTDPGKIFKSMPATSVKTIEVISNPDARYDAEGAAGVLNLVMDQKNSSGNDGYNVSIGAHGGLKGYDGNVYVAGQQGKFSYSVNGTHSYMRPGDSKVQIEQNFPDRMITTESNGSPKMMFSMGNINASYSPDSLNTIGISGSVNSFNMNTKGSTRSDLFSPDGAKLLEYSSLGNIKSGRLGANGSLSYTHSFNDSRKSDLSVIYQMSYEHSKNNDVWDYSSSDEDILDLSDRTIHKPSTTVEHILQADFSTRPRNGHILDAGVKLTLRNAKSSSFSDFEDPDQSTSSKYKNQNNIAAAYAEYGITAGAFNAKAGLRYEYTWQNVDFETGNGSDFSNHYGILVPSVSLGYSLTPSSSLSASYNMRISRPGISYLNPFVDNSNPTSITYGNPLLDVEKTHNVGISYNLFTPRLVLNARLSDSYTGNKIERYSFYKDGLLNTTYGNISKCNDIKLDAYLNLMVTPKTRIIINGGVGYTNFKSNTLSLSNDGVTWNVMAGVQQTLPWDIKGSAYLISSSKSYTLEGWNSGFNMFSLNLSKSFLNDRLTVSAGFSTGLSKNGNMKIENYSKTPELTTSNSISVPMLNASIGLSYTFGNYSAKKQSAHKNVSNDYIEQQNSMESLPGLKGN